MKEKKKKKRYLQGLQNKIYKADFCNSLMIFSQLYIEMDKNDDFGYE